MAYSQHNKNLRLTHMTYSHTPSPHRIFRNLGLLNLLFGLTYLGCGGVGGFAVPNLLQDFAASPLQEALRAEMWIGLGANVLAALGFGIAGLLWLTRKPAAHSVTLATAAFMLVFVLLDAGFSLYVWMTYPASAPTPPLTIAWLSLALRGFYPAAIGVYLLLTPTGRY